MRNRCHRRQKGQSHQLTAKSETPQPAEKSIPEKPDMLGRKVCCFNLLDFGETGGENRGPVTKEELHVQIPFQDAGRRSHH